AGVLGPERRKMAERTLTPASQGQGPLGTPGSDRGADDGGGLRLGLVKAAPAASRQGQGERRGGGNGDPAYAPFGESSDRVGPQASSGWPEPQGPVYPVGSPTTRRGYQGMMSQDEKPPEPPAPLASSRTGAVYLKTEGMQPHRCRRLSTATSFLLLYAHGADC